MTTMSSDNGTHRNTSRWADDRPRHLPTARVANEDDLAMAALLGEASKRSEEQERERRPERRPPPQNQNQRHGDAQKQYIESSRYRDKRVVEEDESYERDSKRSKTRRWNDREYAPQRHEETASVDNPAATPDDAAAVENPNKVKANFGLSGALAGDTQTGNVHNGVTLKFTEPPEARVPNTRWRLYVFRKKSSDSSSFDPINKKNGDDDLIDTYHISRQSSYLFGREHKVADIPVDHPSLSKQHAVLQYRALPSKQHTQVGASDKLQCKPYLMDLESTNGTFINGVRLESARYYELRRGDVITLGASTREYVLLTEQSAKAGII